MHRETVKSAENYCPPHLILYRGRSRTYISMVMSPNGLLKITYVSNSRNRTSDFS